MPKFSTPALLAAVIFAFILGAIFELAWQDTRRPATQQTAQVEKPVQASDLRFEHLPVKGVLCYDGWQVITAGHPGTLMYRMLPVGANGRMIRCDEGEK